MSDSAAKVRYILDTDIVTYQQRGDERIMMNLRSVDRSAVATTVITMYEQLRGRLAAVNRKQSSQQLQLALMRLQATQHYFCTARMLPFDEGAVIICQELIDQKIRIGTQDLRIAAIALTHDATLVTANVRHLSQVPGLQTEDWLNQS